MTGRRGICLHDGQGRGAVVGLVGGRGILACLTHICTDQR